MAKQSFKVETEIVTAAGAIEAHCNTITLINKSAPGVVVKIDGYELNPGDAISDEGNKDEWNAGKYNVTANTPTFRLFVRRKIYQ